MKATILSKIWIIGLVGLVAFCGVGYYVWREEHRPKVLEIYVFELKTGHSIFIRTPEDYRILIDSGPNSEIIRKITNVLPFYSRRIDEIIATDTEGKNVSGLIDVLERYSVANVIIPAITLESLKLSSSTDRIYQTFIDAVNDKNILIEEVKAGDELVSGMSPVKATILFPTSDDSFKYSKASAPELVFRLSYGSNSVTYLGNSTPKVQKFIALDENRPNSIKSDVLIVPHSAVPDSLASELINEIKPKYLVYSKAISNSSTRSAGGKNQKTDPLFFVLNDRRFNVKEGTVKITSDGSKIMLSR